MRPSEDCVELLKRLEGFRARAYLCSGKRWTIGYGSTRLWEDAPVTRDTEPITEPMAAHLLRDIMAKGWGSVRGMVRVPLSQGQCDALTMLVYNIGETKFRTSTLLAKLNAGDYAGAAAQFPRWNKSAGKVDAGLVKRRKLERSIFEKG